MDGTAKPLWQSTTFWGLIVSAVSGLLGRYGLTLTGEDQQSLAAALVAAATPIGILIGLLMGVWGRMRAQKRIAPIASRPPSAFGALVAAVALAGLLQGCSADQAARFSAALDRIEASAVRIGGALYRIECKSGPLPGVVGAGLANLAVIVAPDSKAATKIGAAVAANNRIVETVCPMAAAIEIAVASR